MDADERLRVDYEQTTQLLRTLTDVRFKLLAFVPTVAGASVGLVGHPRPAVELLAVGLLGLAATLGILIYELGNSQIYDATLERAAKLEREIGLGGLFGDVRGRTVRLGRLIRIHHDGGLALVYGAALAGWSYLVAWGALRALDVGDPRNTGAVIGAAVGLLVVAEVHHVRRRGAA